MNDPFTNPWETVQIKEVYDNPWISVSHRDVITPSGSKGIYGVVHFKNIAIGIVPLDEEGFTWLVGQYRYPLGRYSWEIPEGGGKIGVDPLESAQRELLEETGIRAAHWEKVLDMHLSNSVSDEAAIIYLARELTFGESAPEETEELSIIRVPFEKAFEMVMQGEITDSMSVAAILKVKFMLGG